jgi:capsular polysaccharide biosynthesis protein
MNQPPAYNYDELSIKDIYQVLKAYKKIILILPIASLFLALAIVILFIPPKYEASGIIQIGKFNSKEIENNFVTFHRLNSRGFIYTVINRHKELFTKDGTLAKVRDFTKRFNVKKDREEDIITFTLRSNSPELAKDEVSAIIETLQYEHASILDPQINLIKSQIMFVSQQIELLRDKKKQIEGKKMARVNLGNDNALLESLIFQNQSSELFNLTNRKMELESALSPAFTFNSRLLGTIFISENPISPNIVLIGLVAMLLGFFAAIFVAFLHHSLK